MTTRRGSGEGSIYQRHDAPTCPPLAANGSRAKHRCQGRWVGTINGGTPGGKRDRRVVYGKTKAEVIAKMRERDKAATRSARPSEMPTVGEWMDEWLDNYKPLLKSQTRQSHGSKIRTYIKPLLGNVRLDRVTTLQVEQIESRLTRPCPSPDPEGKCHHNPHHGLTVSTARQTFIILKDALNDAVKAKKIAENPAALADAPATFQNQNPHLRTSVANLVIKAAMKNSTISGARALIALEMGLRPGEALGLVWGLVDLDDSLELTVARTIEINGSWGTPKSEAGNRTIPILERTLGELRRLRAEMSAAGNPPDPTARVFDWSHDLDQKWWRDLLAGAGVPHVQRRSARQSAARRLEEEGVPERAAAQFLGHSNVNMTYRYQRGAEVDVLRKAIEG